MTSLGELVTCSPTQPRLETRFSSDRKVALVLPSQFAAPTSAVARLRDPWRSLPSWGKKPVRNAGPCGRRREEPPSHQATELNDDDAKPAMINQLVPRAATSPAVTAHAMRRFRRSRATAEPIAAARNSACNAAIRIAVLNGVPYPVGLPSGPNVVAIRSGGRSHQTQVIATSTTMGNAAAMAAKITWVDRRKIIAAPPTR